MSTISTNDVSERHQQQSESREQNTSAPINVGHNERLFSLIGGATIALLGLRRGTLGGLGLAAAGGILAYRGYKGHCGLYQKLGLNTAKPADPQSYHDHGQRAEFALTIDRSAADLYDFWRNFENLPQIMEHLQSVKVIDENRSQWVARGPGGTSVKWDAEIINDVRGQTIAWRSLGGAQVDNAGSVRFVEAPGGRGTEVHVVIEYIPPGRTLGKWVAKLFGEDPQTQIETDLRRFKQLMETGEVTSTNGQPRGDCSSRGA